MSTAGRKREWLNSNEIWFGHYNIMGNNEERKKSCSIPQGPEGVSQPAFGIG